jgi:hypothetical protein
MYQPMGLLLPPILRPVGSAPEVIDIDYRTGVEVPCPACSESIPWGWIAMAVLVGLVLGQSRRRNG